MWWIITCIQKLSHHLKGMSQRWSTLSLLFECSSNNSEDVGVQFWLPHDRKDTWLCGRKDSPELCLHWKTPLLGLFYPEWRRLWRGLLEMYNIWRGIHGNIFKNLFQSLEGYRSWKHMDTYLFPYRMHIIWTLLFIYCYSFIFIGFKSVSSITLEYIIRIALFQKADSPASPWEQWGWAINVGLLTMFRDQK